VLLAADYLRTPTLFSIATGALADARRMFRQIAALPSGPEQATGAHFAGG
jgi:hypothetical protein